MLTRLFRWAMHHAINDRLSYLEAIGSNSTEECDQTKADIEAMRKCLDMKIMPLPPLLFRILIFAEQERLLFLDRVVNPKDLKKDWYLINEQQTLRRLRAYRLKHFGLTKFEAMLAGAKKIAMSEFVKETNC